MIDLYRRRISALVYEAAKDDPALVLDIIGKLKLAGEIEPDDLIHIERIARKWVRITQANLRKARR